jgi:hypothetical protein
MGQANRRGTFEERKAAAIVRNKENQKRRDIEADKNYDSERPYRGSPEWGAYMGIVTFAEGLLPKIKL